MKVYDAMALRRERKPVGTGKRALAQIDRRGRSKCHFALADIAPTSHLCVRISVRRHRSRPGLSVRDREIAAIASLAAMGKGDGRS